MLSRAAAAATNRSAAIRRFGLRRVVDGAQGGMERWYAAASVPMRHASEGERCSCMQFMSVLTEVAAALVVPFHPAHGIHLEHDAYRGELIKQVIEPHLGWGIASPIARASFVLHSLAAAVFRALR